MTQLTGSEREPEDKYLHLEVEVACHNAESHALERDRRLTWVLKKVLDRRRSEENTRPTLDTMADLSHRTLHGYLRRRL